MSETSWCLIVWCQLFKNFRKFKKRIGKYIQETTVKMLKGITALLPEVKSIWGLVTAGGHIAVSIHPKSYHVEHYFCVGLKGYNRVVGKILNHLSNKNKQLKFKNKATIFWSSFLSIGVYYPMVWNYAGFVICINPSTW